MALKVVEARFPEVDRGLVERLEGLVKLARSGDLQSFFGAGTFSNGDTLTSVGPTDTLYSDIGALEILKARLLEGHI